jgi:DNA-binding PadR family transcriptional regulator
VLRRLEDDGYVISAWSEGDSGPQRRDYELTAKGRALASDWVAHLHERQRVTGLLAEVLSSALEGTS